MGSYGFAIDCGGTFTDIYVRKPDGTSRILKILSNDPKNYRDAPTEGIRRILEEELGHKIRKDSPIPTDRISWIRMGTTIATNALLENKGSKFALMITKGFKDLLYIGNQTRPRIFDLNIDIPKPLYEEVIEVDERVLLHRDDCELCPHSDTETASNMQKVIIEKQLDEQQVEVELKSLYANGFRSLAVVLMHSYCYPKHEVIIKKLANQIGFSNISISSEVMPMMKIVPRGFTTCVDAYLTPKIHNYITNFKSGFVNGLDGIAVQFMQSDGGLCPLEKFCGSRAILSGPAAGVVGAAVTGFDSQSKIPVITFDMGGTSTDVSRYAGDFTHVMETITAGVTIQAPQLDIHTVAAGGGSKLSFRSGLLCVGPESVGAYPGPICYQKGGLDLSITDANLILGRVLPDEFPKIFGDDGKQALNRDAACEEMEKLLNSVNEFYKSESTTEFLSTEDLALGFIDVANETMCRAIKSITQAKGFDTSQHTLVCFGGAGGQHACAIAKSLGVSTVFVHRYSPILSAYGLALADTVFELQEHVGLQLNNDNFMFMEERLMELEKIVKADMDKMNFDEKTVRFERLLHMRYEKTDCPIICSSKSKGSSNMQEYLTCFTDLYYQEFGFILPDRKVIVDDVRIRGIGGNCLLENMEYEESSSDVLPAKRIVKCHFREGHLNTNVYDMQSLKPGQSVYGPSLIVDLNNTILIEPDCIAYITKQKDVRIVIGDHLPQSIGINLDPIQLSIFGHRFMSIAEQMGRILQRTSISTNIKERLDFSCAIFGPNGGLVANAPHIPVHLGGMQAAVEYQIQNVSPEGFCDGDVFLSNHPKAGGSHLPDLTIITPVFYKGHKEPVFFLANRGHHADIGGLVPGSMPPHSTHIEQEGAMFVNFKILEKGVFQEEKLIEHLEAPAKYPGCSGARNIDDNISDLKAQIAANQQGIRLVCELIDCYGSKVVHAYMAHIQKSAESAVRKLLRKFGEVKRAVNNDKTEFTLSANDYMDDGTIICLKVDIDASIGEAVFDFKGTGAQVYSSCNAPKAVTLAAIIYCLRCLIGEDIPLNQGCLAPIKVNIPSGSILDPDGLAAVVGGNVLTSQRICDVIFRAFGAVAASQGCMNNVTFGDENMGGYYETIAGGAGAGPNFHGRSAVHTHMTNTRITDPELLEHRYPVILREFAVRVGSGGKGLYNGGDGCVRQIQFRRPLKLSILSERRAIPPYGLAGGEAGLCGLNILVRKNGHSVNIGAKNSLRVMTGDLFKVFTPGGGGYGKALS